MIERPEIVEALEFPSERRNLSIFTGVIAIGVVVFIVIIDGHRFDYVHT